MSLAGLKFIEIKRLGCLVSSALCKIRLAHCRLFYGLSRSYKKNLEVDVFDSRGKKKAGPVLLLRSEPAGSGVEQHKCLQGRIERRLGLVYSSLLSLAFVRCDSASEGERKD